MDYYLAIDFGTTFTQVAIFKPQNKEYRNIDVYYYQSGKNLAGFPSLFFYEKGCGICVGEDAENFSIGQWAANLIRNVKTDCFEIYEGDNLRRNIMSVKSYEIDNKIFAGEEIIKEIFKGIFKKALDEKVILDVEALNGIILTIPAGFGYIQRLWIKGAAEDALKELGYPDLKITKLIKEPVAAAINCFKDRVSNTDEAILIYDFGGGTCDVALVDIKPNHTFQVIDQNMVEIGGKDFDERLLNLIKKQLNLNDKELSASQGKELYETMLNIKFRLSQNNSWKIPHEINGQVEWIIINRVDFEAETKDLLDQTISVLKNLYNLYKEKYNIKRVMCVGGSSNMPMVEEAIYEELGEDITGVITHDPKNAVVFGAAYYGNVQETHVQDITNYSYGIACWENASNRRAIVHNIIKKGDPLNETKTHIFSPYDTKTNSVSLNIYESDCTEDTIILDDSNINYYCIAQLVLDKLPKNRNKNYEINVKMHVDNDNILHVYAEGENGERLSEELNYSTLRNLMRNTNK